MYTCEIVYNYIGFNTHLKCQVTVETFYIQLMLNKSKEIG